MLNYIIVLYLATINAAITQGYKCEEYILIIPLNPRCPSKKIETLQWTSDCPRDSEDILTYKDYHANKKCVIEFESYGSVTTTCNRKFNPLRYRNHTFITSKPTTKARDILDRNYIINNAAEENDNSPLETKKNMDNSNSKAETATIKEVNNPIDEINLIYANTGIKKSFFFDYNKSNASKPIMFCQYTENICPNDYHDSLNNNFSTTVKTIVVSVVKGSAYNESIEYNSLKENFTNLNCISGNNDTGILYRQYMAFTYHILSKFYCKNITIDIKNNNLSTIVRTVNVYFPTDVVTNGSKEVYIKCAQNTTFINEQTTNVECETVDVPKINVIDDKDGSYNNVINHNKSPIWSCLYTKPNSRIVCDTLQSQKYQVIYFVNCTEHFDTKYNEKYASDYNFMIHLNKAELNVDTNQTHQEHLNKNVPFSDKFLFNFETNASLCGPTPQFNITEGNIFNLWTNDEAMLISNHFNKSLPINIKIFNCVIYNTAPALNNSGLTTHLKLDIILNKQNATNLKLIMENELNETENMYRKIIDCKYPNFEETINITAETLKLALELYCDVKNLSDYTNNVKINSNTNYQMTAESYIDDNKELIKQDVMLLDYDSNPEYDDANDNVLAELPVTESSEKLQTTTYQLITLQTEETQENDTIKGYNTNKAIEARNTTFALTSQSNLTTTESLATITPYATKNLESINTENTTTASIHITTEKYNMSAKGYRGVKPENNEDIAEGTPIVYVILALAVICIISIIIIIGIKIWKPTHRYHAVSRRDIQRSREESEL